MKFDEIEVVIVTYGLRWNLLEKSLAYLDKMKFSRIVIVINGKSNVTEQIINNKRLSNKYDVIQLEENMGSAGGFGAGISFLKGQSSENSNWILLMDDDTFFEQRDMDNLIAQNNAYFYGEKVAYCFYRQGWSGKGESLSVDYLENSFFGKNFLKKKKYIQNQELTELGFNERTYCPYSGFLFPKTVLNQVDLPPEEFFLYVDDTFFTFSIYNHGYRILEFINGELKEFEYSWAKDIETKMPTLKKIFFVKNPYRGLINLRNRVFFDKTVLRKSRVTYWMNKTIYLLIIFFIFMPKSRLGFRRFQQIKYVINLGEKGILGKSFFKYPNLHL